jgi:hypothetical protein
LKLVVYNFSHATFQPGDESVTKIVTDSILRIIRLFVGTGRETKKVGEYIEFILFNYETRGIE